MVNYDNGMSPADMAAVLGNNGNGNGWGFNGDGAWWLIILLLFAFAGNAGWGGFGGGNAGGVVPYYMMNNTTNNDVQRGFDQQAIMGGINGLTATVSNGFANAEVARCNNTMTILQTLASNSMTNMQALNEISMALQQCCCDNRAATAELKYVIAQENCNDRQVVNEGVRDIQTQNAANTTQILNTVNEKYQGIMDKFCQFEMDTMRQNYENRIGAMQAQLTAVQNELAASRSAAAVTAQTAAIIANNEAQTTALEQYLRPQVNPAYLVPNPYCNCGNNNYSYGRC
jgi:hypothetical protein